MKIVIAGVPKAGKTTLANEIFLKNPGLTGLYHTDSLIDEFDWSEQSKEVSKWFDMKGNHIIEGVTVPRALRKWLANNQEGKPCDKIIWMGNPRLGLSRGQLSMGNGCVNVMKELEHELLRRGVEITAQ